VLRYSHAGKTRVAAHPRRTLDREVHRQLQLHLPVFQSLLDLRFVFDWTCLQQQRACSLGGLFSLRKCPHPRLASGPAHAHFTLPPSANSTARESNLSRPAADLRLFFLFSLFTHTFPPSSSDPRSTNCNPPTHSPQLSYNGSAQLILPARAVLCPHAGPLIDHQRASTFEHPSSRPSPTVSDDSSSYHLKPLCCNAGLIREELKASATFPPGRKVLTCAPTSPTTPRLCVRCLVKRRGSAITGLRSCESGIL
jgi:hypothetical protein